MIQSNRLENIEELPIDFFDKFNSNQQGEYDIVTIGDAWFNYPLILKDINDYLSLSYRVFQIDITKTFLGGNLDYQVEGKLDKIPQTAKIIILSGGFYDYVQFFSVERNDLLQSNTVKSAQEWINNFIDKIKALNIPIILHGYDYFLIDDISNSWLGNRLLNTGAKTNQYEACKKIVDAFNIAISEKLVPKYKNLHYLDLRGTLNESDWYDELHPNNEGFRKLSEKFKEKIEEILNPKPQNFYKKILWVDDNPKNNQLIIHELKKQNIEITNAIDTRQAVDLLNANKYDLIVSDMGRGKEQEAGIDLLNVVKEKYIQTPFVFYTTAFYVKKYKEDVLYLGAYDIVTGPPSVMIPYFLNVLQEKNIKTFNKKWILVAGSGVKLTEKTINYANIVGRLLAETGFGLIVGNWEGVDRTVFQSYAHYFKNRKDIISERVIHVIDTLPDYAFSVPNVVFALNFSNWIELTLNKADGFIMVGGVGGTATIFKDALKKKIPTIPITISKGDDANAAIRILQKDKGSILSKYLSNFDIGIKNFDLFESELDPNNLIKILNTLEIRDKKALSTTEFKSIVVSLNKSLPIKESDDLQKYRWGGRAENNGKKLSAIVNKIENSGIYYTVDLKVEDSSNSNHQVAFFLHHTFNNEISYKRIENRVAECNLEQVYESFTAAAYVEDGTCLELDLNDLQGLPADFYHQDISEYFKSEVRKIYKSKKVIHRNDIQKDRWRSTQNADNYHISTDLTKKSQIGQYRIQISVSSNDTLKPLVGDVAFFTNDRDEEIKFIKAKNGVAILNIFVEKPFTIGVFLQDGMKSFEIDLNEQKGFPEEFYKKNRLLTTVTNFLNLNKKAKSNDNNNDQPTT